MSESELTEAESRRFLDALSGRQDLINELHAVALTLPGLDRIRRQAHADYEKARGTADSMDALSRSGDADADLYDAVIIVERVTAQLGTTGLPSTGHWKY